MKHRQTIAERLARYTRREGECLVWTGARDSRGYGSIRVSAPKRASKRIHRVVWEEKYGPIADGWCVCHKCDNPPCCEESHLFLGPHAANMADMAAKGRSGRGSRNGQARLTEEQVRVIRASVGKNKTTATQYGVTASMVRLIKRGKRWGHVHG